MRKETRKRWPVLMLLTMMLTMAVSATVFANGSNGWWFVSYYNGGTGRIEMPASASLTVEVGQQFYVSDLFQSSGSSTSKRGSQLQISCKSSKPSVISINKKTGFAAAKKKGNAKITLTYKKKAYTLKIKVVKKGANGTTKSIISKINKSAKALSKYYGKKITASNAYTIASKANVFERNRYRGYFSSEGMKDGTQKLLVPYAIRALDVCAKLESYFDKVDGLKRFSVKSVNMQDDRIHFTVTLSGSLNAKEITALRWAHGSDDDAHKASTRGGFFKLQKVGSKKKLDYYAEVTKGSNKIEVTILEEKLDVATDDYVTIPLKKGASYIITLPNKSTYTFTVE